MNEVTDFIDLIAPAIISEGSKRGYTIFSTTIAQAIIESRYGKSALAKYHNYFGLKCGSHWTGKSVNMRTQEEYHPGTLVTIKDNFRAYDSMLEGVAGYYDFISTKRYSNLKTARNYSEFAERLKLDGYATSSTYVKTLCDTVRKYNLDKYDAYAVNDLELIAIEIIDGKWGNGSERKARIEAAGYNYETVQQLVNAMLLGE